MEAVICGIDPGLSLTGYAILRASGAASQLIDAGVCRLDASAPIEQRLAQLDRDIDEILREHAPTTVAVERLYAHYKHPRTAILMGHARGVILLAAARHHATVLDLAATQVKRYLTGNGRASKAQVQSAVAHTLSLCAPPEPPDVADAIAIALCAAGEPQRAALVEAAR